MYKVILIEVNSEKRYHLNLTEEQKRLLDYLVDHDLDERDFYVEGLDVEYEEI